MDGEAGVVLGNVFAAYFGAFQMSLQTGMILEVRWFNLYSLMDGLQILPPGVSEISLQVHPVMPFMDR